MEDGSIDECCPPLRALLKVMAADPADREASAVTPELREMFTRDSLLGSDWYQQRLLTKQARDIALWERHVAYLEEFLTRASHRDVALEMDIAGRLGRARTALDEVSSPQYIDQLRGTIGADPLGAIPAEPAATHADRAAAMRPALQVPHGSQGAKRDCRMNECGEAVKNGEATKNTKEHE